MESDRLYFLGLQSQYGWWSQAMKLKDACSLEEKLKSLLMRVKEESEKTDLKFNSKNTKIMASGPIISWQIEGENVWSSNRLHFLGSKITVDGNCNYEIKKHLLLEREAKAKLDSILKSRDTSLLIKVHIVKAVVCPVVMYGCENWAIKKTECQRIDAF